MDTLVKTCYYFKHNDNKIIFLSYIKNRIVSDITFAIQKGITLHDNKYYTYSWGG